MTDLTTRLRALCIEPGDVVEYERHASKRRHWPLRVEESLGLHLADAALDWLVGKLERKHEEVKAYQGGFDGDVLAQTMRAELAEADTLEARWYAEYLIGLLHWTRWAVYMERQRAEAANSQLSEKLTQVDTERQRAEAERDRLRMAAETAISLLESGTGFPEVITALSTLRHAARYEKEGE